MRSSRSRSSAADDAGLLVEHPLALAQRSALGLQRLGLVDLAVAAEPADLLGDLVDPGPDVVALGGQLTLALVEDADPLERRRDRRPAGPARPAPRRTRCGSGGRRAWQQRSKPLPRATRQRFEPVAAVGIGGRVAAVASGRVVEPLPDPAIEVDDLTIRYGDHTAVDGLSFSAAPGTVLALLGPERRRQDLDGRDPRGLPAAPRRAGCGCSASTPPPTTRQLTRRIGVMLQDGGVYTAARPHEVLRLFASYYDDPADPDELLERVGLADHRRSTWKSLSGGEQQRLSLALALVGRPEVAFLDEPTAGIDPSGRQLIRRVIAELRTAGVTVLLTTHDLDEAERLADHVVIIDHGRVLAAGTPAELMASGQRDEIRFGAAPGLDVAALGTAVGASVVEVAPGEYRVDAEPTPGHHRRAHRLAGRARPRPRRPAGRPPAPRGRVPAPDRVRRSRRRRDRCRTRPTAAGTAGVGGRATGRGDGPGAAGRDGPADEGATRPRPAWSCRSACARASSCWSASASRCCCSCSSRSSTCCPSPPGSTTPVDFLAPGILALAVMSTAMVSLGIGTGFERQYRVLKRLGSTPLGRPRLIAAKITMVLAIELVQVIVLVPTALALGWEPGRPHRPGDPRLPARHRRLRRHRPADGRHPAGHGDPRRRQRPLPRAAAARRHDHPADQAAGRHPVRRRAAARRPAGPGHAGRVRLVGLGPTPRLDRADRLGRRRSRSPPPASSAGSSTADRPPASERSTATSDSSDVGRRSRTVGRPGRRESTGRSVARWGRRS